MSNQVEKNVVLEGAELEKIKTEMMHYRGNGLSYKLAFLGIGCSVLAAFVCLNSFYPDMLGFIKILMNIAILLFGFLCCEKVKAYSKEASIALCVIGGICVLRIFWVPLNLIVWYNRFMDPNATAETKNEAGKYLGKIITANSSTINWLPKDGNFRGITAIVLLACAAAAFIASGVIGYFKSVIYHKSRSEKLGG